KVIALEERWRPIAHWRRWSGRLRWDFEAFALPVPGSGDSNLVVSLEARVTNTADRPLEPLLTVSLTAPDSAPPFIAADAADTVPALRWGSAATSAPVCAFSPHARSGEPRIAPGALAPGAAHAARFLFPAYPTPARALAAWAGVPHERRANEARRYWGEALARGTRFDLGDPDVQRALDAARVTLLACREKRGGRWLPIGAPLHYRDVWLRDGARAIAALASCGYSREARDLADGLLLLQWPMGAFLS